MDCGSCIAKRTRRRQAECYTELCKRKRRSVDNGARETGERFEGSKSGETKVSRILKAGFDRDKRVNNNSKRSKSVMFADNNLEIETEETDVCARNKGKEHKVPSYADKTSGLKFNERSKSSTEIIEVVNFDSEDEVVVCSGSEDEVMVNFDSGDEVVVSSGSEDEVVVNTDIEDEVVVNSSREDEVLVTGENVGPGWGYLTYSNCLSSQPGSGSKAECQKGKNFGYIGKLVSSGERKGQNIDLKVNAGSHEVPKNNEDDSDNISTYAEKLESSSGDEYNDSDREDLKPDESQFSVNLENGTSNEDQESDEEYDEEIEVIDEVSVGKEVTGIKVEAEFERRKVQGLDILIDTNKNMENSIDVSQEHNCVAMRTRSRYMSKYKPEISQKDLKRGTFSQPLCVDEELDSSDGHHDDDSQTEGSNEDDTTSYVSPGRKHVLKKGFRKDRQELGKVSKREYKRAAKDYDVGKVLVDSIWEKEGELFEELASPGSNACNDDTNTDTPLPLKFTFGVEESEPPVNPEYEENLDQLWTEFDFAIKASEIGDVAPPVVGSKDASVDTEPNVATLCRQGKHQLVLVEEIGLKCAYCCLVQVEIKDIMPSFSKNPFGRSDRKDSEKQKHPILDELQLQDSEDGFQSGSCPAYNTKGTVWDVIPGIRNTMYPHQREGFEFIWKTIAGEISLEKLRKTTNINKSGSGCIISHAPGTGKTRLTIIFLQTYLELYPTSRPVIIAPRSMLLTWEEEFQKWNVDIPFHNLNKSKLSGKENVAAVNLLRQVRNQDQNLNAVRLVKLYSWKKDRSILGLSYRLFETLAGTGVEKRRKLNNVQDESEFEQFRKILRMLPGLLVLDEGHTPRNDQSLIWKSLSKIETEKRIILSGTPFQNNFDELYNTICLVRPKFADGVPLWQTKSGNIDRKARKGQWTSLMSSITKSGDDRLKELKAMINPFVHVHRGTILQESLPGLRDSIVVLKPTSIQKTLVENIQGTNQLEMGYWVSLISVHPSLLPDCCLPQVEDIVDRVTLEKFRSHPNAGVKTKFIMELIRLSEATKEKVLIFSQYIDPLTFLRDMLKSHFHWIDGKEVLYMDGKLDSKQRQSSIGIFNNPKSEARVLLASTKACSEGISLVGASRVVLLDVVWNPSVERQAISRAYRIGQTRVVYIYHLIMADSNEGEKYCRQAEKDRLSELVFSSSDKGSKQQKTASTVSDDKFLEVMVNHEKFKCIFEKIIHQPKESNLIDTFGLGDL